MCDISIIVPVRNEEKNIHKLCEHINASMRSAHLEYEIIIVDDHSTDQTASFATSLIDTYPLRFYTKVGKQGKGYSILEGVSHAKSDTICMIDADLQYNPKHISKMLQILRENSTVGLIVADRKAYNYGLIRKIGSRLIAFTLGRLLFGIKADIQSGLKVFRKDIIKHVDIRTIGPWSLDIPLLHTTRELGYEIRQVPITFDTREEGESKIHFFKSTSEIVLNALKLRFAPKRIYHQEPHTSDSMIGAGVYHMRKKYITHSTLSHHNSAIKTLHGWQKTALLVSIALIACGFYFSVIDTIIVAFALLNAMYFFDVFFNLYMTVKTLYTSTEIISTDEEITALKDKDLPMYTVLCPLYKEANIIPQFVEAMSKLEWPKSKLDVMLLLEEDDVDTIKAAEDSHLPSFIRIVVVPHSMPKTKPKATNYGLAHAKGEYVVIYDAEDIPDVFQIKKAYLAFQKSPEHVVCLQAKLNYYNPHQNLLTRFFTAEYSLWFDLILPGLQSIEAPLPLGGTSNHFRKDMLIQLEGWDSFNVTEDCDLGIRLARYGYQTAIIDSVTMEEANSNLKNWINQRSRWIKGYMQSYLVHMRAPRTFFKENLRDFFLFQLVVGGKVLALFINPIMWVMSILYFASRSHYGLTIAKFFPGPILYMAVISLVIGNFVYLYYYMIACAKRDHYALVKYVYLVPLYWLAMSFAGYKALSELFYKPHFWQKTTHGLHLKQNIAEVKVSQPQSQSPSQPKPSKTHLYGASLVIAMGVGSILNFLYNAYLGRVLGFEDFALIGLIGGLLAFTSIISSAFSTTVNYRTGFLRGRYGEEQAFAFWTSVRHNGFSISMLVSALWLMATPLLVQFFKTTDVIPWILFAPTILLSLVSAADRGYLSGRHSFGSLAALQIIEPLMKLGIAVLFVSIGLKFWAYAAVPISVVGIFFVGWMFARRGTLHDNTSPKRSNIWFPRKFYVMSLLAGFSTIFFTSADVLLAKHYLSALDAGKYSLLVLAAKMILFMGAFASPFVIPLVSHNEGKSKSSDAVLHYTLGATLILALIGFIAFGVFGSITVPVLFGEKAYAITMYLPLMTGALVLFTVSKVFTDYYLAKKNFLFPVAALILSSIQLLLLMIFHDSTENIIYVMSGIWAIHLAMNLILHFNIEIIKELESKILRGMRNLFDTKSEVEQKQSMRILIFNWRDITHRWAGGAEVYIHELAKRWIQDGHSVTLFCGNDSMKSSTATIDGISIYRHGRFHTVYIWAFIYYMFKFRGKFDVIVDCENGIPFFTPWYAAEKKFLLIHHVHQEVFRKSLAWPLAQFASFLEAKVMPIAYKKVQVITVSPSSRNEIMKHKLTQYEPVIVYNGVDLQTFIPGKKSARPLIMYLGRLQYYKSLNVFIKAAKQVLEQVPHADFVIAGEGEERKRLKQYAEKLGIAKNIRFVGKVSDAERIKLFKKAWVFVNPSFMEGWGITTIEANACGTPTIASHVPGLRDSVVHGKTGFLVEYGNHDEFAAKILKLITDDKLREKMSDEAHKWAQQFSWDISARNFEAIISQDVENYQSLPRSRFAFDHSL